jgi:hypothetical protein
MRRVGLLVLLGLAGCMIQSQAERETEAMLEVEHEVDVEIRAANASLEGITQRLDALLACGCCLPHRPAR